MKALLTTLLVTSAASITPAFSQTDTLLRFDHRGPIDHGWGHKLVAIGDLDGDGTDELAVGTHRHGGGEAGTVHSGRTGVRLYTLTAPIVPMFFGDTIIPISDETGDGLPELAVIGSHSGDANSPDGMILVFSGADGSLLRQLLVAPGVTVFSHMQRNDLSPGDIDGDGHDDLLCRTTLVPAGGQIGLTLLSSLTGQPIYSVAPLLPASFIGTQIAVLSDHDGDGRDDFGLLVREGSTAWLEIRSSLTGALISQLADPGAFLAVTGNGEPLLGIADLDGDGLRDLAVGGVFDGQVALISTGTGALLRRWDCSSALAPCFGSRLIEVEDMNGDGHPDLVALESNVFGSEGVRIFGLDPTRKGMLFSELIPGLSGGYSNADRFAPLPGGDRTGFPTFALFEGLTGQVAVRRYVPRFSTR